MNRIESACSYVNEHFDRFVADLQELCRMPSISAQNVGMTATADELVHRLRSLGGRAELIRSRQGYPAIYAEFKGESDETLLFYNHYDVQPPEPIEEWTVSPFDAVVKDGVLYARGVADNKGSLLSRLHALEALTTEGELLPCTVKFLIEGEEEIGSPNFADIVAENQSRLGADACIWENGYRDEDGHPPVRLGNKGMLYVELQVKTGGQDLHSRNAPILPNAAWRLIWALATLKDVNERILIDGFYDHVDPISQKEHQILEQLPFNHEAVLERAGVNGFVANATGAEVPIRLYSEPTCNIAGLVSGYTGSGQKTIIPAISNAKLDFRLVIQQHPDDILRKLRMHLDKMGFEDIEIKVISKTSPAKTPLEHPFVEIVTHSAREVYGVEPVIEPSAASAGPRDVFAAWTDMPIVGIGVGNAGSQAHAPNENILLEDYRLGIQHIIHILVTLGKT